MTMILAAPAASASATRSTCAHDLPPFIARLRQTRRSAWLLIGLSLLFRVGDALAHDGMAPAIAREAAS